MADAGFVLGGVADESVGGLHEVLGMRLELGEAVPDRLRRRHLVEAGDLPDARVAVAVAEAFDVDLAREREREHDQRPLARQSLASVVQAEVGDGEQLVDHLGMALELLEDPDRVAELRVVGELGRVGEALGEAELTAGAALGALFN